MSGTSVDAIDAALVRCEDGSTHLLASHQHDIPRPVQREIAAISQPGDNEIQRLGSLDRELGRLFADAALELLAQCSVPPEQVRAIGSHGQTVRHMPASLCKDP
ncbi:MAG: anhydro-N-acetylmuramic acid kinase, partial [Thiohalobacterales bacterium]|nr:anhydro-N-acetylmuramic acid kinase [Thiohalobacterales bacterium]